MEEFRAKPKGVVWHKLCRATAGLYALVTCSRIGRAFTAYRRVDAALTHGKRYPGRHNCRSMSPARLRLVQSVESGRLFAGLRTGFRILFGAPVAFWGLFGLFYGLLGVLLYFAAPLIHESLAPEMSHLVFSAVIALLSLPLALCRLSFSESLGNSLISRLILVRLLGVPQDRLKLTRRKMPRILPYIAFLLAAISAGAALFIHPLFIPLALLAAGACGLIFTYPEAGVVLSTVLLPAIWLFEGVLPYLAALILLTWCSYGLKLLFLHRTIRFDLLDVVVLIFGVLVLASGFTGAVVNAESISTGVFLFIIVSDYFLIVNLMTTRAYIRRCLFGVGASVVIMTVISYLRLVPTDSLSWLEGSRAGNAILDVFQKTVGRLSSLWAEHSQLYLVLVFPWLYAYLLYTRRLLRKVQGMIFIILDLVLIVMMDSVSALFGILCVTLLFFLLLGHKWLARGIVALPIAGCGVLWLSYLYPISDALQTILSRSLLYKEQLRDSLWHMVADHPGGIGAGTEAFLTVYPQYAAPDLGAVTDSGNLGFELLLGYGWAGLILAVVIAFLFVQKGLTCLGHTAASKDRAMILGGVVSLVGVLIFGAVRSFITSPRVLFTLVLVVALCSAYENIIFDESDVLTADAAGSPRGEDRIYRRI